MEPLPRQTYQDPSEAKRSVRSGRLFQMLSGKRREVIFWVLQAAFWSIVGLIGYVMILAFQAAMPDAGLTVFIRMGSGFALTSGLRWVYRLPSLRKSKGFGKWVQVAGCCLAAALLELSVQEALSVVGDPVLGEVESVALRLLVVRMFILGVWSALYQGFHLLEDEHSLEVRAATEQLAAREHELRHLQAQMAPNFVLNALKTVIACKNHPEAVEEVTRNLADYLRYLLQETRPLEPLSREIDAFVNYLNAQKAHYGKKLVCRINCDPQALAAMVPPMLIQPLLEDALRGRPLNDDEQVQIWLTANVAHDQLRVTVSHTGSPARAGEDPPEPAGLRSLRQQLQLLMGPLAVVDHTVEGGWTRVAIEIPIPGQPLMPAPRVMAGKAAIA
jgi:two-component system, LytTR family, sensor kinase